jgi:hypothetical protein
VNDETPEALLNAAPHLFLRQLGEPEVNSIRIRVQEAHSGPVRKPAKIPFPTKNLQALFSDARPIVSDSSCFYYDLTWKRYVAYAVSNESYAAVPDKRTYEGRWLRRYSSSVFLDFVAKGTFASSILPGPFTHWGIVTLNHVVDVVSTEAPEIRRYKGDERLGDPGP